MDGIPRAQCKGEALFVSVEPEDIANAVLFFASDMSSFVTGETMPVAGGFGLPSPMYAMYQDMKSKG